ncbi:MAG: alpha/beta hydrolase [Candidatus Heimdallarchaeota archaeon]
MTKKEDRYIIDNFHAKSLENNPLNSPVDRDINIYLPPDYYEDTDVKYPVIYFLHGYSSNNWSWTTNFKDSKDIAFDFNAAPPKILEKLDIDRLLTFEKLDELIQNGELRSFIYIQPDGSLEIPNIFKRRDLRGKVMTKGSFYVNSPYTGNYMDYIINDLLNFVDSKYRTIPDKYHRALMGGSMGGYGALYLGLHHPDKFNAISSLSPANAGNLDRLDWELRIPVYTELFGEKMSAQTGDFAWKDIMDTYDLIFSNDNKLIPSIKRDENGDIIDYNKKAIENWQQHNLINLLEKYPDSLKKVHLQLNCERTDEFGLADAAIQLHEKLLELKIEHDYELYADPKAALTPHILGIGYHILPGIKFCLQFIE